MLRTSGKRVALVGACLVSMVISSVAGAQGEAATSGGDVAAAGASQAEPAPQPLPVSRPGFALPRFEEDWSEFHPEEGDDFWDPIKRIDLSDDGAVWASFGGELRVRVEDWQNFGWNDDNDDTFLLGRALFYGDLHVGENFRVFVEGISALSTDRDLPGGRSPLFVNELDLQNALVDVRIPAGGDLVFTVRVGRQEFKFGKQRLVSPLPWANSMRKWDGATLIVNFDRWRIDAFASRFVGVKKYDFDDWSKGAGFYGAYAAGKVGSAEAPFDLDLYFLGLSRASVGFNGTTGDEDRFTLGGRFGGKIGGSGFDFDLEGTYQFGEVGSDNVSAFAFASVLGYSFVDVGWKPRLWVGFDYASGDDSPGGSVQTFNQLFPLGHAYLGFMDFIGRQNIIDFSLGFSFKPHKKFTARIDGHLFWRASTDDNLYNAGGGVVRPGGLSGESEVGQELDLTAIYKVDRHLDLRGGFSVFFPGDFIKDTGPDDTMYWIYAQATYKF